MWRFLWRDAGQGPQPDRSRAVDSVGADFIQGGGACSGYPLTTHPKRWRAKTGRPNSVQTLMPYVSRIATLSPALLHGASEQFIARRAGLPVLASQAGRVSAEPSCAAGAPSKTARTAQLKPGAGPACGVSPPTSGRSVAPPSSDSQVARGGSPCAARSAAVRPARSRSARRTSGRPSTRPSSEVAKDAERLDVATLPSYGRAVWTDSTSGGDHWLGTDGGRLGIACIERAIP